jgi:hypothetical protein
LCDKSITREFCEREGGLDFSRADIVRRKFSSRIIGAVVGLKSSGVVRLDGEKEVDD